MKTRIFNILAMSLIIAAFSACKDKTANTNGNRGGGVMEADYVVVKAAGVANSISISGTLLPAETAMLSAQGSGKVIEIYFEEGQKVNKGQLLVRLDSREWMAQQKLMEAELETAQNDLARKQELADIKGVSVAALDDAQLKISSIKASKTEIDVKLDYASIRAPFSGTIGLRNVSEGAYLSPGAPVAQLVQTDPIKLEFNVPEKYATQVAVGQKVSFTIAGNRATFSGTVYAMEPAISANSRTLKIRAKVPNKDGELIPGAFAEISLGLDSIPDGLMIPTDAIVPRLNNQLVYKIVNGKAQEAEIVTGIRTPHTIQAVSGLSANDTIMISGLLQVRTGLPVKAGNEFSLESLDK